MTERVLAPRFAHATVTAPVVLANPGPANVRASMEIGTDHSPARRSVWLWLAEIGALPGQAMEAMVYLEPEQARMLARRLMAEADEAERGR